MAIAQESKSDGRTLRDAVVIVLRDQGGEPDAVDGLRHPAPGPERGPVAAPSAVPGDGHLGASARVQRESGRPGPEPVGTDPRALTQHGGPRSVASADPTAADQSTFINGIYVGARSASREEQLQMLLRLAALRTASLPLRGIGNGHVLSPIRRLYIPLATDLDGPEALPLEPPGPAAVVVSGVRVRPLDACAAIAQERSLVVLGGPGAGKTTLLAFLAHALATKDHKALPHWPEDEWSGLPLYLRLREFAAWVGRAGADVSESVSVAPAGADWGDSTGGAGVLVWDFLRHELAERNLGFCQGTLAGLVRKGRVLFLWDGLDEVPPLVLAAVRASLLAFHAEVPGCRVVVTSRALSYDLPGARLPEEQFPVVSLRRFDRRRIDRFVSDWFRELAAHGFLPAAEAEQLITRCREGLRAAHLYRRAGNPLLLTLLTLVYSTRRELPEARAKVFEAAVEVLLRRLDDPAGGDGPRLDDLLRAARRDRCDLIRLYERLAMRVQHFGDQPPDSADGRPVPLGRLGEDELLAAFATLHPAQDRAWAQALLDLIKLRPGLLREEGPDEYDFMHRALREYLAGCHLAHAPDFGTRIAGLARDRASWWREPTLHAVGFLVHCQREWARPVDLIERLCPPDAATDDDAWRRVWLAGEVAAELGVTRAGESHAGLRTLERVRHRLAALVEAGALGGGERAAAAVVLARLGDPRFQPQGLRLPTRYHGVREPALGLVKIRRGRLVMGGLADLVDALPNEFGGEGHLALEHSFWIGRYPVTVGQFRAFLTTGGYQRRDWWLEPGWTWCEGERRCEPAGWTHQCYQTNRPVVGVTWFEAAAYAAWLNAQLRKRGCGRLPDGLVIRLPTEAEWALAARGSRGRVYPWGDTFSAGRANCRGTLGHPSAVGLFPQGATPEEVHDLAGNVWEWTLSLERPYPYHPDDGRNDPRVDGARILRGGSWDSPPTRARTAARAAAPMRECARDIGFRLVLAVAEGMV